MPASIYLDNSATTAIRPEVRDAMLPFLSEKFGNPSSIHKQGRTARQAVDKARQQVAALLNTAPEEVYFTPCATYSNNTALIGAAMNMPENKRHLITTNIEHPSCAGPAKYLEGRGFAVTFLNVDRQGCIDIERLKAAISDQTSIISLMWANNEIGSLQPIEQAAQLAADRGIFFHTDAVQVPGKLRLDMQAVPASSLSLSGHKFFAPKGVGVLYVRKGLPTKISPMLFGGGQEGGLFPGTEGVANIVAIGKAAELAQHELPEQTKNLRAMQLLLLDGIKQLPGVKLTGPADIEARLPGHVSFLLPNIEGEAAVMQCDIKGLFVSSASACKKGIMQPSHVVSALGFCDKDALGAIRISAGRFNTLDDCRRALEILGKIARA